MKYSFPEEQLFENFTRSAAYGVRWDYDNAYQLHNS